MDINSPEVRNLVEKAKRGDLDDLMAKLSSDDADKLKQILGDREATNRLLATPQAQQLLKLFMKGE